MTLPQKGCGSAATESDLLFCYFYLIIYEYSKKEIHHIVGQNRHLPPDPPAGSWGKTAIYFLFEIALATISNPR